MSEPLSKIPDGMRYHLGAEARLRRAVEETVLGVFDGWSYEEVVTPSVDYYALFELGMGRQEANRAFRFTDTDGRLLALRPDVTSSVARAAATLYASRTRPLRLCYAAPVFRQQTPSHADWRRSSTQLGCEFIGVRGLAADAEVLAVAAEALERLALRDRTRITLNSVEIFNGVAQGLALDTAARERMRHLIDVRDVGELERFLAASGAPAGECADFCRLIRLPGGRETLTAARRLLTNTRSAAAVIALEELWRVLEGLGLSESFEIDFGDVAGLDYYTGMTFKIYVAGAGSRVGSGGRYDGLIANFGRAEPAVGFVLDLDAVTEVLMRNADASLLSDKTNGTARLDETDAATLFAEARRRRAAGERVRIETEGTG